MTGPILNPRFTPPPPDPRARRRAARRRVNALALAALLRVLAVLPVLATIAWVVLRPGEAAYCARQARRRGGRVVRARLGSPGRGVPRVLGPDSRKKGIKVTTRLPPPEDRPFEELVAELQRMIADLDEPPVLRDLGRRRGEGTATFRNRMRRQPDLSKPPLLVLGVDGVLAIKAMLRVQEEGLPEWMRFTHVRGRELFYDIRHRAWLAELDGAFDVEYCTLWGEDVFDLAVILGVGDRWHRIDHDRVNRNPLEHEPFPGRTSNQAMRIKMSAIVERAGDRPLVLIDADAAGRERFWAEQRTEDGLPTLVIEPFWENGLEREHVDLALAFARKLRDRKESLPPADVPELRRYSANECDTAPDRARPPRVGAGANQVGADRRCCPRRPRSAPTSSSRQTPMPKARCAESGSCRPTAASM